MKILRTVVLAVVIIGIFVGDVHAETEPIDTALLAKIDQLFIVGFRGYTYQDDIKRIIAETNVGGVILFDYDTPSKRYVRNIQSALQLKNLIASMQVNAATPLFIAIDEEGGSVSRLKRIKGYQKTASAQLLGTKSNVIVERVAKQLGLKVSSYGFNMDFAPSLDVNVNKKSPAIGKVSRSFSVLPSVVSEKGIAFMRGLSAAGITPVGKHFPGHGSAAADSHLGFVDVSDTYKDYELEPFKTACAAGLPAVMVAHVFNKNVDPLYPATLSAKHIEKLKNIGCSTQLVISDDMDMRAITTQYGRKESLVRAINAGIDVLVISNNITSYDKESFFTARKMIYDAVKAGEITESRITEAYSKVQTLKASQYLRQ